MSFVVESKNSTSTNEAGEKKVVCVLGATGGQGGSVVASLVKHGGFKIRALTRDPSKAQKLADAGVELVKGDYSKTADLESFFAGAYAVYATTNFWDPATGGNEETFGKLIVDAAYKSGIKHLMLHTLPHAAVLSAGKYKVPHFDLKALVETYARAKGFQYTTFFTIGFYYQNWQSFFMPQLVNGEYVFTVPLQLTDKLESASVTDMGDAVLGALVNPTAWTGETVHVIGQTVTVGEYIEGFKKQTGKPMKLNSVPPAVFAKFGFPGAEELANMFAYYSEFGLFGNSAVDKRSGAKAAGRALLTFDQFLAACPFKLPA